MLKVTKLTKIFSPHAPNEITAVENLNLNLKAGEIYGLIGPNGAGKTTTLKMIVGLIKPSGGQIQIGSYDLLSQPEKAKSCLGYIPDDPFIYEKLTGREFLQLVGELFEMPKEILAQRISQWLKVYDLDKISDGLFEDFSRGNKQKIAILAALLHEPKLLVVDEPIVGLDPQSVILTRKLFLDFARQGGTILISTHTLTFAQDVCQRFGILKEGRLIHEAKSPPTENLEKIYLSVVT
ncbi:MAG: ABC transporter ATP-binding protein [bacterium]|nr:ABC transporter ATP-binding protein [bacterium]